MSTETRTLPVPLHDSDFEALGKELASCLVSVAKIEDQKKALNETIKPMKKRAEVLSQAIEDGQEMRPVSCTWEYNWAGGTRSLYRNNTGEILQEEAIPESIRQQTFAE